MVSEELDKAIEAFYITIGKKIKTEAIQTSSDENNNSDRDNNDSVENLDEADISVDSKIDVINKYPQWFA